MLTKLSSTDTDSSTYTDSMNSKYLVITKQKVSLFIPSLIVCNERLHNWFILEQLFFQRI